MFLHYSQGAHSVSEHTQCTTTGQTAARSPVAAAAFIKYTSAHTRAHSHTRSRQRTPKGFSAFLEYKKKQDAGTVKVASSSPIKNQFKRKNVPGRS